MIRNNPPQTENRLRDDVTLLMRFWGYQMAKQIVGLLFGGGSGEHEVLIAFFF
ncbi:MAG: hypothetical protein AAFW67_03050 [Cyanobacteria bacterium J06638_38]